MINQTNSSSFSGFCQLLRFREITGFNYSHYHEKTICEKIKKKEFKDSIVDLSTTGRSILSIHETNLLVLKTDHYSSTLTVYDLIDRTMKWKIALPQQKALYSFQIESNGLLLITFQNVVLEGIHVFKSFLISEGKTLCTWPSNSFFNSYRQLSDSQIFFWERDEEVDSAHLNQTNLREGCSFVARNLENKVVKKYSIPENLLCYEYVEAKCFDEYIFFYSDSTENSTKSHPSISIVNKYSDQTEEKVIHKELFNLTLNQKRIKTVTFFDDLFFVAVNGKNPKRNADDQESAEMAIYSIDPRSSQLDLVYHLPPSSHESSFIIDAIYVDQRYIVAVCACPADFLKKQIVKIERQTLQACSYLVEYAVAGFEAVLIHHHFIFFFKNREEVVMQVFDLDDLRNMAPCYEEKLDQYDVCGFSELGFLIYLNKQGQVGLRDYRA